MTKRVLKAFFKKLFKNNSLHLFCSYSHPLFSVCILSFSLLFLFSLPLFCSYPPSHSSPPTPLLFSFLFTLFPLPILFHSTVSLFCSCPLSLPFFFFSLHLFASFSHPLVFHFSPLLFLFSPLFYLSLSLFLFSLFFFPSPFSSLFLKNSLSNP